jgi:hypothetical protein
LWFFFFSYWDFFPLANPFASPHVFVRARWFILTLFTFVTIHAPWQGRESWGHSHV